MVTHERLTEVLDYDPVTGIFTWKLAIGRRVRRGAVAGSFTNDYIRIVIDGKKYRANRLAWFYVKGEWPVEMIDHENGNTIDNRIDNLRAATRSQNNHNRRLNQNSTTGIKGVIYSEKTGQYTARVMRNKIEHRRGPFDSLSEATTAVKLLRESLHGDFVNHGVD